MDGRREKSGKNLIALARNDEVLNRSSSSSSGNSKEEVTVQWQRANLQGLGVTGWEGEGMPRSQRQH